MESCQQQKVGGLELLLCCPWEGSPLTVKARGEILRSGQRQLGLMKRGRQQVLP